jgi:tetratricopeptide (TPR) repeat protein
VKTIIAPAVLIATLAILSPRADTRQASTCISAGQNLEARLRQTTFVMEPRGHLRGLFRDSCAALQSCPREQSVWYVLLRSGELAGEFPVNLEGRRIANLNAAAQMAVERAPSSPRIATILARATHTLRDAEAAVKLDASYAPARVALADALLNAGDPSAARTVLEKTAHLQRIPGAYSLLARARLTAGDPHGAIQAAQREPQVIGDPVEPGLPDTGSWAEAEEIKGEAYLFQQDYAAAGKVFVEAVLRGSKAALEQLRSANPPLREALEKMSRRSELPPDVRRIVRDALKSTSQRISP